MSNVVLIFMFECGSYSKMKNWSIFDIYFLLFFVRNWVKSYIFDKQLNYLTPRMLPCVLVLFRAYLNVSAVSWPYMLYVFGPAVRVNSGSNRKVPKTILVINFWSELIGVHEVHNRWVGAGGMQLQLGAHWADSNMSRGRCCHQLLNRWSYEIELWCNGEVPDLSKAQIGSARHYRGSIFPDFRTMDRPNSKKKFLGLAETDTVRRRVSVRSCWP